MQTTWVREKPKGGALPRADNQPVPCRPPPDPLQEWLFQRPGPERFLYVRAPALSRTRPLGVLCLLTNELLSNSAAVANKASRIARPRTSPCGRLTSENFVELRHDLSAQIVAPL